MCTSPPFSTQPALPESRSTPVRHLVLAVTVAMAVILYLDRFCVSFAERYIKEDLALSEHQIVLFISAFFWAYALGQVPSGWLGDRLGSRGVLALYIVSWSFFTAMIGLAGSFAMLLAMRLGCGLGQAGAYPTAGSLVSRWVPFSRRGFASGLVALGGRLGAVIAPILTATLMLMFVPLSNPATFDEHSFLDGPALCARLLPPEEAATNAESSMVEQRIHQGLPEDAQWVIEKYGTLQRDYDRTRQAIAAERERIALAAPTTAGEARRQRQPKRVRDEAGLKCDPHDLGTLAAGLNHLLSRSELFRSSDFERFKNPEREALQLEQRRVQGAPLSPEETMRLNRLCLEGLFPDELGKLYVKGWRPVLMVYGIAGLVVALLFWICFRNSPSEHPWCNAAERALIAGADLETIARPAAEAARLPISEILRSASLWLSSISQFATNIAWLFFVTFFPRYLAEVHHVPILERSVMTAVPPLAGIAGMFVGGHLTDSLVRRIGLRWGRALPMALTRFFAAATYLVTLAIDSPWPATIAFACGFFFVDLGVSAVWAFMQDVGGKHVGAILGWGNMWGNFGAAVAPLMYDAVLGPRPTVADWSTMFVVCAGMFIVSGLAALGINAALPIGQPGRQPATD